MSEREPTAPAVPGRPLGVVVDLDDTLYPQSDYLAGAAAAVARAAAERGLDGGTVHRALLAELAAASDAGGTIDRALVAAGVARPDLPRYVPALVSAFTTHTPERLTCYPGVESALRRLRAVAPLACLTDGNPSIQEAKLGATKLRALLPVVVITDSLGGREARKPHPRGLLEVGERLGIPAHRLLVIGDRPSKDVAVAAAVGARAIRIRQGEYSQAPDEPAAWAVAASFPEAAELALRALRGHRPLVRSGDLGPGSSSSVSFGPMRSTRGATSA